MHRSVRATAAVVLLACLAGCDDEKPQAPAASVPPQARARPAPPKDTQVIRKWADTLRAGRVAAAARLFTVPAVAANGTPAINLLTRRDVRLFNKSLPCGAVLVDTRRLGPYTVGTFRLTERPGGGGCGTGTGNEAARAFRLRGGKIEEWRRVAVPSGPPPEPKPSPEV